MKSISRNKALKQLCRKDYFLNTTALLNKRWKSDDQEEIKVKVSPTTANDGHVDSFNIIIF